MSAIQMLPRVLPNLGEKAIGLTKEFMGTVFDNASLREQGQAQQDKATKRIEQFQRELKADLKRSEAQSREQQQKAHQGKDARKRGSSELSKTGPQAAASSTAERLKGGLKQATGAVIGNEDMRREGAVQQDKAAAEAGVAREEGKAEESRAKANAAEQHERAARS